MPASEQSVVFLTTPTSGSQSLVRVISALLKDTHRGQRFLPQQAEHREAIDALEPTGNHYLIRGASFGRERYYRPDLKYIVNFRDPRDMLCNQYYWLIQHPVNDKSDPEEIARDVERRRQRYEQGIDASVLLSKDERAFWPVLDVVERSRALGADNVHYVSYAQLCLDFEPMVDRLAGFLDVEISPKAQKAIDLESPSKLEDNPKWIGNKWVGTDTTPGRHKDELRKETIATLNERYGSVLSLLRELDLEKFQHLYATND